MLAELENQLSFAWDGTFKIAPRQFYQVVTFHIFICGKAFPVLLALMERLTNGRITPMEFIDKNTHSADGVIQQAIDARRRRRNGEADLEETSDDESDDYIHEDESQDESENEDPNNDGNLVPPNNDNLVSCKSCGQDCVDKYLLVPCGHHPFCNNCQLNEFCTEYDANVQIRAKMN